MRSCLFLLLFVCFQAPTFASVEMPNGLAEDTTVLEFDVYLNDKKVGKHLFTVAEEAGEKRVRSNASFDYKILFITAYQYEHSAAEHWEGDCLTEIDADTNANGKRLRVSGEQSVNGFLVQNGDDSVELPKCVMTFAYWNAEILSQPKLLNPQTGEYLDIRVEQLGEEMLKVRDKTVAATRYKLAASKIDLTIWYSSDKQWLALESVAKGGHIIRYELS